MHFENQIVARGTPGTERALGGAIQFFRDAEFRSLLEREMESPEVGQRDAITLRRSDDQSLIRVALRPGGKLPKHRVAGPFTLIVLSGQVVLRTKGREEVLNALDVAAGDPEVEHSVEAITGAHVLISMTGVNWGASA